MPARFKVKVIAGSTAEAALGWKCCNLQGMNLELHVTNAGAGAVTVQSVAEFSGPSGRERVDYLYPHGAHELGPGVTMSFLCDFDENRLRSYERVTVFDGEGGAHQAGITGEMEEAKAVV